MSHDLDAIIRQLSANIESSDHSTSTSLLTRAKLNLLHQNALIPSASTPHALLHSAQHVLELGALISIRMQDAPAFTRYFQQLQPFYTLSSPQQQPSGGTGDKYKSERSKVTGLYLLLLLSQGDYAGFHTQLEALEAVAEEQGVRLEEDEFVRYPVRLEQWLMEGSYDRMWKGTRGNEVPSEEFAVFSDILIGTIRSEVASCSEKAYPSIPVANAKSLLFLDSEGGVVGFSQQRGWTTQDGRVYFPAMATGGAVDGEDDVLAASGQVIRNALGYARELETIV